MQIDIDKAKTMSLKELKAYARSLGIWLRGERTKEGIIRRLQIEASVRRMISGLRDGANP